MAIVDNKYQVDVEQIEKYLNGLIRKRVDDKVLNWLEDYRQKQTEKFEEKRLFMAFGMAGMKVAHVPLKLTACEIEEGDALRAGFQPEEWTLEQLLRVYLLLQIPDETVSDYLRILDRLFACGDVKELVALYSALPVLSWPEALRKRAAEGVRTNMEVVFDAVALRNPYPADYLEEGAWNQLVLKALFMVRPIYKIVKFDSRRNQELATTASDYAHERWSAGRAVTPELWRTVGPFLNDELIEDLKRVKDSPGDLHRCACALACYESGLPAAQLLLKELSAFRGQIESGELSWESLGADFAATL